MTTPLNSLTAGKQDKDSKIICFLKALPYLLIPDQGLMTVAKRLGITPGYLLKIIYDLQKAMKNGK